MTDGHHLVQTVLGPDPLDGEGTIDAHTHVWIAPVAGAEPGGPVLDDAPAIAAELTEYGATGGEALVDCQPPGAGRDARRLVALSRATGVSIVASTGFHLDRYYSPQQSPWRSDVDEVAELLSDELRHGMREEGERLACRPGVVKVAHPGALDPPARELLIAAAEVAAQAGVMLVVHTERGQGVEELADLFASTQMSLQDVMLCHVDKRPDAALHRELARAGFMLEYDTFLRRQYSPETGVWPLIEAMLAADLDPAIACGLDLADVGLWRFGGGSVGMAGLRDVVAAGLHRRGALPGQVRCLTGDNVRDRLQRAGTRLGATR